MHIQPFAVEMWMNEFENDCELNLAETCVESLTVAELLDLAGMRDTILGDLLPLHLTYGAIEGSDRLRGNIARLYAGVQPDHIVVTHGAIGANALVYQALVGPGDRVVSIVPSYQQHTSIPESLGAEVCELSLQPENDFLPDVAELRRLVGGEAKLISITNPNNPTGALIDEALLAEIVEIAAEAGAYVLCDEVYRGINQAGNGSTDSIVDLYDRGISTGSMSKAFSLAGLRLGWIAAPAHVIEAVSIHRDYNTISVGMIDDLFASIALEVSDKILDRNRAIVRTNLAVLDQWLSAHPAVTYVKPTGGTTAMLRYENPTPSHDLCTQLLAECSVLLTPGSAFGMEGHVRIGYANNPAILAEGLARLSSSALVLPGPR